MFIDGIKAVPNDSAEVKIWRFRYDQAQHRNLCVVAVPPAEQALLRAALRLALFGIRDAGLKAALVQITDNSGDSWVFERQGEQFRCFRARQFFDARPEHCLQELFKDYLPAERQSSAAAVFMKEYDLSFDGSSIEARPSLGQQPRLSSWERAGMQKKEAHQLALAEALGMKQPLSRAQISEILTFGESLSRRLLAIQQQTQEIDKTFHQLSRIDVQLASRLEKEVALINQISTVAEPLLDPAKNPRILYERQKEVEAELEELLQKLKLSIESLPLPEPAVDWSLVLQALTRFLASDKLEKAARKSLHDAKNQLKPAFDEYKAAVGRFLQYDRHLIQELETCLKELDEHVRLGAIEQEKQRDNIAGKLNKLLGFDLDKGRPEGGLGPHTLELSRAAVNQCLHHLGRLYSELEQNQGEHDHRLQDLEQRYEKIQAEATKAREQWQSLSRQLQLPAEIGVRDLLAWINQRGRIALLSQRRLQMQEEMQEQRQQHRQLGQLLEEWRTHTGSQKSVKLDQSLTILAEARALLQYADKKKSQLKKLEAVSSKLEAYQQIKAKLTQDLELVQDRWRQALSSWGLPLQALELESWEKIARVGRELLLLEELFEVSSKPLKNEMIFAAEALEAPLTFYHFQESSQGNKARLQLLQQVELADDAGLALIFTSDKVLIDMLLKLGLARCQALEPKAEAPQAAPATKPLMSEKARAALEVFASKQSSSSRSPI